MPEKMQTAMSLFWRETKQAYQPAAKKKRLTTLI